MSYIKVEMDATEIDRELDRLVKGPTVRTYGGFERLFVEVLAITEEDIHIETGSLFSTGKLSSRVENEYTWEGTITFGGAAPGRPRDPAYYGVYELARGGDHFFFQSAHDIVPHDMVELTLEFYAAGEKSV